MGGLGPLMGGLGPVAYLGFQKGIGYRITGFYELRCLVGDPLLVEGLGPGAPAPPPKSGPGQLHKVRKGLKLKATAYRD